MGLILFGNRYFSVAINYQVEQQTVNYAAKMIEKAITEHVLNEQYDNLFVIKYDTKQKVTEAYLDTYKVNKILSKTKKILVDIVLEIDEQEDFQSVNLPLGYFITDMFLFSDGVNVPITLKVIGSANCDCVSEVTNYGINSSMIEIYLKIDIVVAVTIPLQKNKFNVTSKIPLAVQIINSEVPNFYYPSVGGTGIIIPSE